MTFTQINSGDPILASTAMENWRHVNYSNDLIPVDTNGAGTSGILNLGTSTNKWNDCFAETLVADESFINDVTKTQIGSSIFNVTYNNSTRNGIGLKNTNTSGREWVISEQTAGILSITDNTASLSRLSIDSSGNIGIGTSAPACLVDIQKSLATAYSGTDFVSNAFLKLTNTSNFSDRFASIKFRVKTGDSAIGFVAGTTDNASDFVVVNDDSGSFSESFRVTDSGQLSTGGETDPDAASGGATFKISETTLFDSKLLTFKGSNTAHGITSYDETDTVFSARMDNNASFPAGNLWRFYSVSGGNDKPIEFQSFSGIPFASDSQSSNGAQFVLNGFKKSTTTATSLSNTENLLALQNDSSTQLIVKGNGDSIFFGKIGVGNTSLLGQIHIESASAGAISANADSDELVLENSGNVGMNLFGGTSSTCSINMGDSTNNSLGFVRYNNNTDELILGANGAATATFSASGNLVLATATDDIEITDAEDSSGTIGAQIGYINAKLGGTSGKIPFHAEA